MIASHADRQRVVALVSPSHPCHSAEWESWVGRVLIILHTSGLAWMRDPAITYEDVAQSAYLELVRSLPGFAHQSSLDTWVYRVVVRTAQRLIRDSYAQKRSERPESLADHPDLEAPIREVDLPEAVVDGHQLAVLVDQILAQSKGGVRLAAIFMLWAIADRSVEEIAEYVRLHPSRVRALLREARQLLVNHPEIHEWLGRSG